MKRKKVQSSNVASIGYSAKTKTLEVGYLPTREGQPEAVYQYKGVPPEVAKGLDKAESKGRFLAANVKSKYPYEKVEG
jgi:hypothetical protein